MKNLLIIFFAILSIIDIILIIGGVVQAVNGNFNHLTYLVIGAVFLIFFLYVIEWLIFDVK